MVGAIDNNEEDDELEMSRRTLLDPLATLEGQCQINQWWLCDTPRWVRFTMGIRNEFQKGDWSYLLVTRTGK